MKRFILIFVALIILSFAFSSSFSMTVDAATIENPIEHETFDALLGAFTSWIVNIGLALAPLVIVYGGFLHITAAGNPEQASKGKKLILYAVIGLIVVLLAGSLIDIIKDIANTTE